MTIPAQARLPLQYTSAAAQAIFVYSFKIFVDGDLLVYLTPVGQTPDPVVDLLTLTTDYTVTGAGVQGGGTVILVVPATENDIITIVSNVADSQTVDFSVGGTFDPNTVENVMDKFTILLQEVNGVLDGRAVLYEDNAELDNVGLRGDNVLPVLADATAGKIPIWSKNTSGNLTATLLDEDPDSSTLRADLANDGSGTDGARLVGYFNVTTPASDKVNEALDDTYARIAINTASIATLRTEVESVSPKNILYGGYFGNNPFQRGSSFTAATTPPNSDGNYLADRWALLSDGNDIVDVTLESSDILRSDVQTLNKQFGYVQILENIDALQMRVLGGVVSLATEIKSSATLKARMAVLGWTGAVDSPTKDVVATWNGDGTNPTLAASWTYLSTPVDLQTTASFVRFKEENIDVNPGSTFNNYAVFIWIDDTAIAAATTFDILYMQLVNGKTSSTSSNSSWGPQEEFDRCQRYFEKSYDVETTPGTITDVSQSTGFIDVGSTDAVTNSDRFVVNKFKSPSIVWYSPTTGTVGFGELVGTGNVTATGNTAKGKNATGWPVLGAGPAGSTFFYVHWTADSEIGV